MSGPLDLEALEALIAQAGEEPRRIAYSFGCKDCWHAEDVCRECEACAANQGTPRYRPTAEEFRAARLPSSESLRNALPALIAELREARAENERLREALKDCVGLLQSLPSGDAAEQVAVQVAEANAALRGES